MPLPGPLVVWRLHDPPDIPEPPEPPEDITDDGAGVVPGKKQLSIKISETKPGHCDVLLPVYP